MIRINGPSPADSSVALFGIPGVLPWSKKEQGNIVVAYTS